MAKAPEGLDRNQLVIASRRVLLDGLTALRSHSDALTVVGAQAVYLRTPGASMQAAPFTSDADLCLDPVMLDDQPLVDEVLQTAGFTLKYDNQPGLWERPEPVDGKDVPIELDILVGKVLAKKTGSRSAKIPPHGKMTARSVTGLEACAVDRSPMVIPSLDPADERRVTANVAGPAALLIAKAYKIAERHAKAHTHPDRLTNKDAGDVYRIMATAPIREVAETFTSLFGDPRMGTIATEGFGLLRRLFGGADTPGTDLAVEAHTGDVAEETIRLVAPAYIDRLVTEFSLP
ncbi:hypothetical protein E1200_06180 [Actinomadura sp. GC306]|uniref:hypothetical protein n=1 Tax=Actinomadura sp. GC306 TaxID=2530367 RepID=UPI001046D429|nr:hypothetical protein [Actinomadura sp. GC306]TDC70175.1 hypothetical protein E1200_06180 [Actinomadura sp. GC306]